MVIGSQVISGEQVVMGAQVVAARRWNRPQCCFGAHVVLVRMLSQGRWSLTDRPRPDHQSMLALLSWFRTAGMPAPQWIQSYPSGSLVVSWLVQPPVTWTTLRRTKLADLPTTAGRVRENAVRLSGVCRGRWDSQLPAGTFRTARFLTPPAVLQVCNAAPAIAL